MLDRARADRDEHALVLFSRMLTARPVWVDSPANQMTHVQLIGLDDDGEVVVYDKEGNDRPAEAYLLRPRWVVPECHSGHYPAGGGGA